MLVWNYLIIIGYIIQSYIIRLFHIQGIRYMISMLLFAFIFVMFTVDKDSINECIIGNKYNLLGITQQGCMDVWHLMRFCMWAIIGQVYPHKYILVFGLSICWEVFEHSIFKYKNVCNSSFCGRYEDPLINMLGYIVGSNLLRN